jgi:uncharacterized membrane protein YbhN (UPF0104 family)
MLTAVNAVLQVTSRYRAPLTAALAIAALTLVAVVVLPRIVDFRQVWEALRGISLPWMIGLIAAATVNVLTFAPPLMATLPGIGFRPALAVTLASTASTYVAPGGPAVGMGISFAMLRGYKFEGRQTTVAVALNSGWNMLVTFGMPAVALALLAVRGESAGVIQGIAMLGLVLFGAILGGFALALSSEAAARALGDTLARGASSALRLLKRPPVTWSGEEFAAFRRDAIGIIRARWPLITVTTLVGHLTVFLVLLVTLRAVGVDGYEVSVAEALAAWSLVRVLAALPVTPGGLGVVEVGLAGALVAFGAPNGEAFAAVLVYRFLTVVPPVLLGTMFGVTWRRHHPEETAAQAG